MMRHATSWKPGHGAWLLPALMALLMAGCGGGGGDGGGGGGNPGSVQNNADASVSAGSDAGTAAPFVEANAPAATGNTATDGYNWFNFRRQQMGLAAVARNALIDKAALNHSRYQALNEVISHEESSSRSGYTGTDLYNKSNPGASRLSAAGYTLPDSNYAFGEVISKSGDASGFNAAEDLITAIYHRFVVFEPKFLEAGAGAATSSQGYIYFTTDFTTAALSQGGLGSGRLVPYPFPNQQNIVTVFYSDQEEPDPVPNQNAVGYPVSVHADITSTIGVQSFTIRPRGGSPMNTRLLTRSTDPANTTASSAAIIPLSVLNPQTTYDVQFSGSVDSVPVSLSWSFTTR